MVCPLKELDTSALSGSPRRLTEGVLEAEGPTSVEAGVASCLLLDTEPVFRRLRDDFWDGMVFEDGTKRLGGIELPKREYVGSSRGNTRLLLEEFPRIVEEFPGSAEEFPRSEEGFPLEVSARPSDVSLGERSRRLLILGSTRDD